MLPGMKSQYLSATAATQAASDNTKLESAPPPDWRRLPPWKQVRLLRQSQHDPAAPAAFPLVELRGDRAYLRALRAAELTAWEGGPSAETGRFIRRQLGAE
jgi:hypothetical protein